MENLKPFEWIINALGLHPSLAGPYIHITMSIVAFIIITITSLLIWNKLRDPDASLLPDDRPTLANFFEIIIAALIRMMWDVMGPDARRHIPLIGALFIYILVCNLMSVIPWIRPPTENVNTNLACAVVVFVYYNYVGIRAQGIRRYFRHLAGPIIWIAPLMLAIEIVSHLVRPISLSVRLFGNIMGDHMVLGLFSDLVPFIVPTLFMILAIFISFIQAFVFTLLSIIYISLATGTAEER